MPRIARVAPGDGVYHMLNRSAGRGKLFRRDADDAAFGRVLAEAHERCPLRLLAYWSGGRGPRRSGRVLTPWPVDRPADRVERVNAEERSRESMGWRLQLSDPSVILHRITNGNSRHAMRRLRR
jgi:hypothetical protein